MENLTNENSLTDWAIFIKSGDKEELEKLAKKNKYLDAAYKKLVAISQDEQKRREYNARLDALMEQKALFDMGYSQGRAEEREQIISKLKANGVSDSDIKKWLGSRE